MAIEINAADVMVGTIGLDDTRCAGCGSQLDRWNDGHTVQECLRVLRDQITALREALRVSSNALNEL